MIQSAQYFGVRQWTISKQNGPENSRVRDMKCTKFCGKTVANWLSNWSTKQGKVCDMKCTAFWGEAVAKWPVNWS